MLAHDVVLAKVPPRYSVNSQPAPLVDLVSAGVVANLNPAAIGQWFLRSGGSSSLSVRLQVPQMFVLFDRRRSAC